MKGKSSGNTGSLDGGRLGRELIGLFAIFFGLLLILGLATFDARDPWLNHVVSGTPRVYNKAGLFGSYTAGFLLDFFGYAAWVVPAFFCLVGTRRILGTAPWPWWRWAGALLMTVVVAFCGASNDVAQYNMANPAASVISAHGGGLLGHWVYQALVGALSPTGAWLIWTLCLLLSIQMLVGFSWLVIVAGSAALLWQACATMISEALASYQRKQQAQKEAKPAPSASQTAAQAETSTKVKRKTEGISILKRLSLTKKPTQEPTTQPELVVFPWDGSPNTSTNTLTNESAIHDSLSAPLTGAAKQGHSSPMFNDSNAEMAVSGTLSKETVAPQYADEEDLPPWVKDFEEGRLGPDAAAEPTSPSLGMNAGLTEAALANGNGIEQTEVEPSTHVMPWDAIPEEDEQAEPEDSSIVISESVPSVLEEAGMAAGTNKEPEAKPKGLASLASTWLAKASPVVVLPPLNLIESIPAAANAKMPRSILEEKGRALMTCLSDFGIQGELVGITPGPVVTMFEVRPAPGVRVSRIANLSDDLALALKAVAVRIQAPVPGTDTVGIEIPNEVRETVGLRELLSAEVFEKSASLLTLALGKDIAGQPAVADLATMPHLLVAGATGAGKSVGINSIIISILYKAKPEEVRLLLIDPKRVEMAVYEELPHLVHPVVTDMQLAKNALDWAVKEMERRYTDIGRAGVRKISDYNAKLKSFGNKRPPGMEDLEPMPYLVIIIDELADLMLVASKEVETSIVRLAQLARAAGIHLIIATQRPSVDVVTGIIKANFPCRISFQVTSKHDSRTILDAVGAEYLLGKGDMLFKPGGGRFQRLHGAFVSDNTVQSVVDFWKAQQKPAYAIDFAEWGAEAAAEAVFGGADDIGADPLYNEAVEFVRQQGKASISLIQRRFRIGFNKAARFIEQMEQDGIVGPQDGSKPRQVIR